MNALFDTNILIDYLNGVVAARDELTRYRQRFISPINWIEVMVGARERDERPVRAFLSDFTLVELDVAVAGEAVALRRAHRLRLPDAIIWASARCADALLVTRNTRDFPAGDPGLRIPYAI